MPTVIGLDVGSTAVRAAQLSTSRSGPHVLAALGEIPLPEGVVEEGEVADPGVLADTVRTLWSRLDLKTRRVALGVANQQVVVRQVDLPWMPEDELRASLPLQVGEVIPIPVDQAVLDCSVLDETDGPAGERLARVLLVAAQRSMVDALLSGVRDARLEPVLLDLDAFAMLRALAPPSAVGGGEGELLVDVGSAVTNLVVHQGGIPRFVRVLLLGGGRPDTEPDEQEVALARLVEEIRGSLDYYASQVEATRVQRVAITGGSHQLDVMRERLQAALNLEIVFGRPFQHLQIGDVGMSHEELVAGQSRYTVAVGLALGALEP